MNDSKDHRVRYFVIAAAIITVLLGSLILVPSLMEDTWELYHKEDALAQIARAKQISQTDPLTAYKLLNDTLREAQHHKITDSSFSQEIASAQETRKVLYKNVQEKLAAEAAEKAREKNEEERRIAEAESRKQEELKQKRISEENRKQELERLQQKVAAYQKPPQSARDALNVIKKLLARTEVGINYRDYSSVVGESWGDIKIFVDSPEGKSLPEFSELLLATINKSKLALDVWSLKIDRAYLESVAGGDILAEGFIDDIIQPCWKMARKRCQAAEALLSGQDLEENISAASKLTSQDLSIDIKVRLVIAEMRNWIFGTSLIFKGRADDDTVDKNHKYLDKLPSELKTISDYAEQ